MILDFEFFSFFLNFFLILHPQLKLNKFLYCSDILIFSTHPLYIYIVFTSIYLFIIIILGNIFWRLMTSYKLRAQDKQQDHHLKSKYLTTDHPLHSLRPSWLSVKRTHFTMYLVWRSRVSCVVIALWVALITFLYVFYLLLFIYYYYLGKEFERECNSHWINRLSIWIWSKFIRISRLSIYIDL